MNRDFIEMLSALSDARAEFLVVGAHALAAHGMPRATGDLDIWIRRTPANAARVYRALQIFGAPLESITEADLMSADMVIQIGVPPARIDLLTGISGVSFEDAWPRRIEVVLDGVTVHVIGRADFVANKQATGRPRDLSDIAALDDESSADS